MEENNSGKDDQNTERVDHRDQRDDGGSQDGAVTQPPAEAGSLDGIVPPKKNWGNYKIQRNKRPGDEPVGQSKGESKKRKHSSKISPEETVADDARAEPRAQSSSDSSPESSGGESHGEASSEDSSSESEEEVTTPAPAPSKPAKGKCTETYTRFDPGEGDSKTFTLPSQEMIDYASRKFTTFVSDRKIKETIMDEYPVPTGVPGVEVPRVDDYIPDIFASRKQDWGKYSDETFTKIQSGVTDIMGPLAKVWSILDTVRMDDDSAEELDLYELLDLVENTITFDWSITQTKTSIMYRSPRRGIWA